MPLYYFCAYYKGCLLEDRRGSQFADDEMAIREIAATALDVLGVAPSSLVISDDTGRVVSRRTEAAIIRGDFARNPIRPKI